MGHESLIMQQSDIGEIANSIKDCLRCGKCKPVCTTHVPRANLLYSPRNKILATSLLVEAFLYEEQTRRGISIKHWEEFEDVADHCTVCHKCLAPCPVDIDFGDVSMNMRNLLRKMGQKSFRPANAAAMFFLNATQPETIKVMRMAMVDVGFKAQRAANNFLRGLANKQTAAPPSTVGQDAAQGAGDPLRQQEDAGRACRTRRRGRCSTSRTRTTFRSSATRRRPTPRPSGLLLPGLRLGAAVLAGRPGDPGDALARRRADGAAAGYLCCGYPQRGSGDYDKAEKIITDNRVLFHRVANTLNYLDIKTVVVSCGTCYDQLQGYKFEEIFPGSRIIDIHEFLLEKGITLGGPSGPDAAAPGYLFHDPCHSPMKLREPLADGEGAGRREREEERPLLRRERHLRHHPARHRDPGALPQGRGAAQGRGGAALDARRRGAGDSPKADLKILTSCPSCLQGLQRYKGDLANGLLEADYIVVEMANRILGDDWLPEYVGARQRGRHRAGAGLGPAAAQLAHEAQRHPSLVERELGRRRAVGESISSGRDPREEAPRRPGVERERALAGRLRPELAVLHRQRQLERGPRGVHAGERRELLGGERERRSWRIRPRSFAGTARVEQVQRQVVDLDHRVGEHRGGATAIGVEPERRREPGRAAVVVEDDADRRAARGPSRGPSRCSRKRRRRGAAARGGTPRRAACRRGAARPAHSAPGRRRA
jgi:Fe-S oxidoreductase